MLNNSQVANVVHCTLETTLLELGTNPITVKPTEDIGEPELDRKFTIRREAASHMMFK